MNFNAKQLISKCQKCNSTQSVVWTKCPHCFYEQMHAKSSVSKRQYQIQNYSKCKYQSDNENDKNDLYDDMKEFDQNHNPNIVDNIQQSQNQLSNQQRKNKDGQRLVQNNVKVDNTKSQNNYKIDGSFLKYIIMFILLILFLGFLLWDLNGIVKAQVSETVHQVNECTLNYQINECEEVLNNSLKALEIKQYCLKQKICKEKDPYKELKILKVIVLYLTEITHESLENMNSKVAGIILIIYFFGLTFSYFLDCICPRRSSTQ